jgi:hypothetical protein
MPKLRPTRIDPALPLLVLERQETGDEGTFGCVTLPSGVTLATAELPWRDNLDNVSCVPAGKYTCRVWKSPSKGRVYRVYGAEPARDFILIHVGNWAGDVSKGLRADAKGCILVGRGFGRLEGQGAITGSGDGVAALMREMGGRPFELHVLNAYAATDAKTEED